MTEQSPVDGLQIPAVQRPHTASLPIESRCHWNSWVPTPDQLRWPIQVGAAAGLTSLLLTLLPASERFFGSPAVIGTAVTVVAIEGTAGGSFKRGWLMALAGSLGALIAFGLFAICIQIPSPAHLYAFAFSAAILVIPVVHLRYYKPTFAIGCAFGLNTSENVFLASLTSINEFAPWSYSSKRALASIIGPLCSAVVSQFVMRKAARPTAANSLANILTSIGKVLERLSASLGADVSTFATFALSQGPSKRPHSKDAQTSTDIPTRDKRYCLGLVESVEVCQQLLAQQKVLIDCASQEISWKRPHRFPAKEYEAIVSEIRNLFYHIASLVFALNLYISSTMSSLRERNSQDIHPFTSATSLFTQHRIGSETFFSSALSCAGESDVFIEIEGASIGKVARHIAGALSCIADCLKERRAIDTPVRMQIAMATEAIAEMNSRREQRRQAFSEILFAALTADVTAHWNIGHLLEWTSALGLSASAYLKLSEDDKLLFWDAYWLDRDRISTSCATLTTLKDSLLNLCLLVDGYVAIGPLNPSAHVISLLP